ncbi:MAG: queuosine precursor transporter [Chlamydiales bacterium]|nr:queuosine precursor transporter [Chlamydiales bacterium]MCH9635863.1 queuosine precursor transporter [Chlamydiales bacterium]MCH9703916.1 queuosine precursor transporter [Chlamydiota bacterium]
MHNFCLLILYVLIVSSASLFMLRLGKEAASMWLGLLSVALNLFVLKEITILGLHTTASEALVVGYLLTLNLIQEFYGRKFARRTVINIFILMLLFVVMTRLHLAYEGGVNHAVFTPLPRLFLASLVSFFVVQFFDISLFSYLRGKLGGRFFPLRTAMTLFLSQCLDTALFTLIGLWGIVDNPLEIILFSIIIKSVIILIQTPVTLFSRRIIHV